MAGSTTIVRVVGKMEKDFWIVNLGNVRVARKPPWMG